jgi:hypothetical protein
MEKVITISGKDIPFKATASTPRKYRAITGRDLLKDLFSITSAASSTGGAVDFSKIDTDILLGLAYTMAKQADPEITPDMDEWLDQFEPFDIINACGEILMLWGMSQKPIEKSKKK